MPHAAMSIEALHKLMKDMSAGLENLPPTITAFTILEKTYTLADLKQKIDDYEKTFAAADAAAEALQTALTERGKVEEEARTFMSAAKTGAKVALGKKSAKLAVVGVPQEKTAPTPTLDEKKERAAKGAATRKARHTMGQRQKAKIHGQVPPAQTPPAQGQ